ncbi:uncharacterized protein LOC144581916 [Callithrix jacchus]
MRGEDKRCECPTLALGDRGGSPALAGRRSLPISGPLAGSCRRRAWGRHRGTERVHYAESGFPTACSRGISGWGPKFSSTQVLFKRPRGWECARVRPSRTRSSAEAPALAAPEFSQSNRLG